MLSVLWLSGRNDVSSCCIADHVSRCRIDLLSDSWTKTKEAVFYHALPQTGKEAGVVDVQMCGNFSGRQARFLEVVRAVCWRMFVLFTVTCVTPASQACHSTAWSLRLFITSHWFKPIVQLQTAEKDKAPLSKWGRHDDLFDAARYLS